MVSCKPTFSGKAMTEDRDRTRDLHLATVTRREQRHAGGFRRLSVDRRPDGSIFIGGHDLGAGVDPGPHLRAAGVPIEFWNRVGD